ARLRYWIDVIRFFRPYVLRGKPSTYQQARGPIMLRSYFTIALRNLKRHAGYASINITGLAVGLACCLFIFLFVRQELSYDRFHAQADRIARVSMTWIFDKTEIAVAKTTTMPGPGLQEALAEVVDYVRLQQASEAVVQVNDQSFKETGWVYADSSLFDVFSFPLIQGDTKTALNRPNTVVLTQHIAEKYFGNADPVGQTLLINTNHVYEVTGVMADVPANSHIQFDMVGSFASLPAAQKRAWDSSSYYTYILLSSPEALARVREAIPGLLTAYFGEDNPNTPRLHLMPLTDVYLHGIMGGEWSPEGDIRYVYIFSAIAALILLIACINYMNLATARAVDRAREVGMRKTLGAHKMQLFAQFMGEAFLTTGLGLLLAIGLVVVLMPLFNTLTGKTLMWDLRTTGLVLAGTWLVVGLLAGSYPALVLSNFQPVKVLKGRFRSSSSGIWLRKGLVVFQFAITTFLIASTLVIYGQLQFIQNKELGFDKERVVVLPIDQTIRPQVASFKEALASSASVQQVATASHLPIDGVAGRTYNAGSTDAERQLLNTIEMDDDFIDLMGLHLLSGEPVLETDLAAPGEQETPFTILLNESAAQHFGWTPEEAVGQILYSSGIGGYTRVKGVVEDFHFDSLHKPIEPLVLVAGKNVYHLLVRTAPGDLRVTLDELEHTWKQFAAHRPFEYEFLDQEYAAVYRAEQRVGRMFTTFSLLAILVACLGLLGLAAYAVVQRTKEIGIRKVLGASPTSIVLLLSKEFVRLVVLAFIVAAPLAYFAMQHWLEDFAFRIDLSWWIFALAGGTALLIALLTVSFQSIKAALTDPIKSLRYE
ncbi:MAG TPA: ABC transporter permease, partial [Rhodothermales bacterium]|nr:ABC transporter permease [Rhodothermales bacterium]